MKQIPKSDHSQHFEHKMVLEYMQESPDSLLTSSLNKHQTRRLLNKQFENSNRNRIYGNYFSRSDKW